MNVQIVCDDATHPRHQVTIATVHARRQVFASDSPDPHEPGYYGELQWWARLDGMTPAALLLLLAHLKKGSRWKTA